MKKKFLFVNFSNLTYSVFKILIIHLRGGYWSLFFLCSHATVNTADFCVLKRCSKSSPLASKPAVLQQHTPADVLQFSSGTIYLGTASDPTGEGSFPKAAHLQMPIASPKWFLPALVTNLLQLRIPEILSLGLINLNKQPTEFNFLIYHKGCCKGHR